MLSKVLSLDKLSCSQIWNIEQEKDREKDNVGGSPAKLNEKKGDGDLKNIAAAVIKWEMLAATNNAGENERQWKKVNDNTYDISSITRVTKKFLEVSRCSRAKQRQRNVQKNVLHVQSSFFAN